MLICRTKIDAGSVTRLITAAISHRAVVVRAAASAWDHLRDTAAAEDCSCLHGATQSMAQALPSSRRAGESTVLHLVRERSETQIQGRLRGASAP